MSDLSGKGRSARSKFMCSIDGCKNKEAIRCACDCHKGYCRKHYSAEWFANGHHTHDVSKTAPGIRFRAFEMDSLQLYDIGEHPIIDYGDGQIWHMDEWIHGVNRSATTTTTTTTTALMPKTTDREGDMLRVFTATRWTAGDPKLYAILAKEGLVLIPDNPKDITASATYRKAAEQMASGGAAYIRLFFEAMYADADGEKRQNMTMSKYYVAPESVVSSTATNTQAFEEKYGIHGFKKCKADPTVWRAFTEAFRGSPWGIAYTGEIVFKDLAAPVESTWQYGADFVSMLWSMAKRDDVSDVETVIAADFLQRHWKSIGKARASKTKKASSEQPQSPSAQVTAPPQSPPPKVTAPPQSPVAQVTTPISSDVAPTPMSIDVATSATKIPTTTPDPLQQNLDKMKLFKREYEARERRIADLRKQQVLLADQLAIEEERQAALIVEMDELKEILKTVFFAFLQ